MLTYVIYGSLTVFLIWGVAFFNYIRKNGIGLFRKPEQK